MKKFSACNYYRKLIVLSRKAPPWSLSWGIFPVYPFTSYFCIHFNLLSFLCLALQRVCVCFLLLKLNACVIYLPLNAYSVNFVFLVLNNLALLGERINICSSIVCGFLQAVPCSHPVLCTENNFLKLGTVIKIVKSVKTSFVSCRGDMGRQSEVACSHCGIKLYGIL